MCRLFVSQDPKTYAAETRAIRLHGHATSIRLEAAFWSILEEIARKEGMSVARFAGVLHDEITARHDDVGNFASFLRVTCMHYLANKEQHACEVGARRDAVRRAPLAEEHALERIAGDRLRVPA
ncbi:ribbon-helix-helix domain-containing protein [Roseomonas sp. NAR14]|uniref:Ribbon-helix-helix domain-containing protein n=1 Tax=Roseomonas acroporae TaxID=2937791 RepID=A0A9X2BT49_9PROT|nr:ribbon-helix-helix domain-containing protein [Roseomonas acroporae]MCK8782936.1 ribbon-helix-helix domain-containing protein [Roseomonas acroporae]